MYAISNNTHTNVCVCLYICYAKTIWHQFIDIDRTLIFHLIKCCVHTGCLKQTRLFGSMSIIITIIASLFTKRLRWTERNGKIHNRRRIGFKYRFSYHKCLNSVTARVGQVTLRLRYKHEIQISAHAGKRRLESKRALTRHVFGKNTAPQSHHVYND